MRQVNIVVEGKKDLYFLHQFILQRFGQLFDVAKNGIPDDVKKLSKPYKMTSKDDLLVLKIYDVEGFGSVKAYRDILKRPQELAPTDEFVSAVIFDADMTPPKGQNNANHAGFSARPQHILDLLGITNSTHRPKGQSLIFLFPNNQSDGDIETLMESMIVPTQGHSDFINVCWHNFERCVSAHGFNPTTRKSKMNEYTAAFDSLAWENNGINRCFARPNLWDWNVSSLIPLFDFVSGLLTGSPANSFDAIL